MDNDLHPASETLPHRAASHVVQFFLWDDKSRIYTEIFMMKISKRMREHGTIAELRPYLVSETQLQNFAGYDFCSKNGAIVPDSWTLNDYETLTASIETELAGSLAICLRTPILSMIQAEPPSPFEIGMANTSKQISAITDVHSMKTTESPYPHLKYQAGVLSGHLQTSVINEKGWDLIAQNTSLLSGLTVDRYAVDGITAAAGLSVARYAAFQFKKRAPANSGNSEDEEDNGVTRVRIPDYVVDDQSYVSVFETTNSFQSSLLLASATENDITAAESGRAFGHSIDVIASYATEDLPVAAMPSSHNIHVAYNFPRAALHLDYENVELTEHCQKQLSLVKDTASLTKFLRDYGQFFATRVQLGGRLFATEKSKTIDGKNFGERARLMKIAAATSFGRPQGADNIGNSVENKDSDPFSPHHGNLAWQATGGDTLLCNSPATWRNSIPPFYNWRLIRRDSVKHLVDAIGAIPGYEHIPSHFKQIVQDEITQTVSESKIDSAPAYHEISTEQSDETRTEQEYVCVE